MKAYYASLPPNIHIMTDEEMAEEAAHEANGDYLDIEAFLAYKPDVQADKK